MHPDVAAVLRQAQQLQSVMDEQLHRMNSKTFTGTDELDTVRVTLDGHHRVTGAVIEDGLLGLGVEEVQKRLNEALENASAAATASFEADRDRIDAAVADITDRNR
ncbi:DNA-binding protein [Mycobacterium sp. GA-1285]|nr:DNA-binding protein [Mycobacterium sp. GA-1285]